MKYLSKENIKNKRVILRCDLNVPIKNNSILDDTKIIRSLKTINYLLKNNNKVIILSHFGRVKNEDDLKDNSLKIVYEEMKKHLPIVFIEKIFRIFLSFSFLLFFKKIIVFFLRIQGIMISPKKKKALMI